MYTDMFKLFNEQSEKALAPYLKFNKLMTKNAEVLTEMQLNAVRTYSEMGLAQMKAASEVKDVSSLAVFNSNQLAVLTRFSQQLMEDGTKVQSIAKEFKQDIEEMTNENIKAATPA